MGSNDSGFTLVELLISIALLALLSTLVLGAISTSRVALDRIELKSKEGDIGAVQHLLRELLAEARPPRPPIGEDGAGPAKDFAGEQDSVHFRTGYAPRGQFAGIYDVEIRRASQASGAELGTLLLVQRISRDQGGALEQISSPPIETTLLSDVRKLRIRYFGSETDHGAPQWSSSWSSKANLPLLIAIELELNSRDGGRWPTLVVPLMLAQ